jgi:anti-sigma-K factor RskA
MNVTCKDRERIFEDGTEVEWIALESHAASCVSCAEELRSWKSLSIAAAELRDYADSPELWVRIHQALIEQAAGIQERRERWSWRSLFGNLSISWRAAAATAFVVVLMVSAGWLLRPTGKAPIQQGSLLKSKALTEVEHAESAYAQAIDKLVAEARPQLENPATPLMANYREKLLVLDSAIDDLRTQTGQNPSNAHLRYQLLAMYQEKQRTLEEILEEKR